MSICGSFISRLSTMKKNGCVGHNGTTRIPVTLSCIIFCTHLETKQKGGKAEKQLDHTIEKASIFLSFGSGFQETCLKLSIQFASEKVDIRLTKHVSNSLKLISRQHPFQS